MGILLDVHMPGLVIARNLFGVRSHRLTMALITTTSIDFLTDEMLVPCDNHDMPYRPDREKAFGYLSFMQSKGDESKFSGK
jgi:hypothetical protein